MLTTLALAASACGESLPPEAPRVDAPPSLTNENPILIEGDSEPDARIQVRGGAALFEGIADAEGRFAVDVTLNEDAENVLLVSQVVADQESASSMVTVTHDGMPPAVPSLEDPVTPTRLTTQTIRGTTEAGATVTITGGEEDATGTADGDGAFAIEVMLTSSASAAVDNDLSVVATDAAGNASPAATLTITFDPNIAVEAPTVDDLPAFTSESTITVTGAAEAGVGVTVVGGATDGTATVGGDGAFSVDVGLRPNQSNTLLVFAVSGTDTSPAATITITHDDLAPDAPEVAPQASPTGAETVTLNGLTEALAEVSVSGGASAASGTADADGVFSIDVDLTVDATNDLSVTATDRAGNESAAATLSIVQDSTLEQPITVDPVSSPTSDATVTLTGSAAASVDIEITGGASTVTTTSDGSGAWTADVTLNANAANELRITRPTSGVETVVTIVHDDIAPEAPALNAVASPTGNTTVTVSGTAEARARISVSGATAAASTTAGTDGRFSVDVVIAEDAESTLSVIATDRAGNSSSPSTMTITHSSSVPEAPIVDEPNPAPTSMAMYTVTGRVPTPGAGIQVAVRGASADVTGDTDMDSGVFSIEVTLNANASNELSVIAIDGSIESPPTLVTIVHDDIAPDAPNAERMSAAAGACAAGIPTGGTVSGSMNAVEGGARVRVENVTRSTTVTTTATDGGSFSASIGLCTGNVIRVTAIDRAGNESTATEITGG